MKRALAFGMKGQYCEINDKGRTRFLEIYFCEYSIEDVERLKKIESLEDSILGEYMVLITEPIPEDTRFLYKLYTYLGVAGIKDKWEFNENISEYERIGFVDIEILLNYCKERWGISKRDFRSIQDTNIPQ